MADIQEPQGGLAGAVERPAGMDEYSKARAALVEQQNKLLASLEERNKPQAFDFWASLARGFADPNAKLFSQGLGSAVGNLQDLNESQKVKEMQMYQIRSQVAQQQLDMQRKAMMSGMLEKQLFGRDKVSPSDAINMTNQAGLQRGPTNQAAMLVGSPKQTAASSWIDSLDPATKQMVLMMAVENPDEVYKMMAKAGVDLTSKNLLKPDAIKTAESYINMLPPVSRDKARDVIARANVFGDAKDVYKEMIEITTAYRNNQLTEPALNARLEDLKTKLENIRGTPSAGSVAAPSAAPGSARSVMAGSPESVRASLGRIEDPAQRREALNAYEDQLALSGQKDFGPSVNRATVDDDPNKVPPASNTFLPNIPNNYSTNTSKPSILSPVALEAIEQKKRESAITEGVENRKELNKPFVKQQEIISNFSPMKVSSNKSRLAELEKLVEKNPETVGLMVREGPMAAFLQGLESGITTPWGSVSAPIYAAKVKLLSKEKQDAERNIVQLISELNQQVMKEGKDIYGPQISIYDAQQMAKPGFSNIDPAKFIMYLAKKQNVTNHFMGKMSDALNEYRDKYPDAGANKFFTDKSSPYKKIVEQFYNTYNDLVKNRSPYR